MSGENGSSNSTGSPSLPLSDAKKTLLARRLKGIHQPEQVNDRIEPRPPGTRIHASVDEYRIWLHSSMHPESPTYNEPITISYNGWMKPSVLQASLDYFLKRREIWRTNFTMERGELFQDIHPKVDVPIAFYDLSDLPPEEAKAEEVRLTTKQAIMPFRLNKDPLLRVMLVRLAPDDHRIHAVIHHIVFDGASVREAFVPELATIYAALDAGTEPQVPPRELQYGDYTLWRERQLTAPSMMESLAFWKNELGGELEPLRLPADRMRPPVISMRGRLRNFVVPLPLTEALRTVSHAHNVTLNMTLLAAFSALLFRYSGQEDVVLGTGADGRRKPELRGMMGYILDTVPVRTHPSSQLRFSEYLGEVKKSLLNGLAAAEAPFDHIVQAVAPKRDQSIHPIFQTFYSFLSPGAPLPQGWDLLPRRIDTGSTKFDLYLEVEERPEGIGACFTYSTDLFDAATIERIIGHWETLLAGVCEDASQRIGDLPLLTLAERGLMLVDWNQTAAPLPAKTIHQLFAEQALRTPDRVAVEFEGSETYSRATWTFAELDRESQRLAGHLRHAGARKGTLVAICLERSHYLSPCLLAILRTGAAYLPLDPNTPESRLALCLEDARPSVVLTQRSVAEKLPYDGAPVLTLEDLLASGEAGLPPLDIGEEAGPEDAAYVIYTSGSTGKPKGVEIGHQAAVNLLLSMYQVPGWSEDEVLVGLATISFDISVTEMFLPLITGARLVIASHATTRDPYKIAELVVASGCTFLSATASTWRAMVTIDWAPPKGMTVLSSGEPMPRDLAEKLLELGLNFWNFYGPTETTIWSSAGHVKSGNGLVSIGRPLVNQTMYILDANQQPVPIGVPGELYIGGLGVAHGYRGQPELTAQKFVRLPVAPGDRLYRSGDYAIYHPDGAMDCLGRADNQVKIRGHRIELEEVEQSLGLSPQIAHAAAKAWVDLSKTTRLSAYVVPAAGQSPTAQSLREYLRVRLPEYMIPSDFVLMDKLPITSNGKIDRKALLQPQQDEILSGRSTTQQPMTPEEIRLARIWSDVLDVKDVSRDDNFFDLGGHSLLLVVLFARINRDFGANLPITTIFDAQTLAELALVLRERVHLSSLVPVQTAGSKPPLFVVHSYLLYHALSTALGNDQPLYGLRELETDEDFSIEARARRYVEEMRTVQPHGPYRIAGWCAAGPLAVEIAKEVLRLDEEVAVLELFDSWLPGYAESMQGAGSGASRFGRWKTQISYYLDSARKMSPAEFGRALWTFPRRVMKEARDDFYVRNWSKMNVVSTKLNIPLPQFMHNTTFRTFATLREFKPQPLPVRMTLIRASQTRKIAGGTEACGWEQVATLGVDVLWAPGDHETMFRDANLRTTAALVARSLVTPSEAGAYQGMPSPAFVEA
jgi:amino acid adenylation domain-containing protein